MLQNFKSKPVIGIHKVILSGVRYTIVQPRLIEQVCSITVRKMHTEKFILLLLPGLTRVSSITTSHNHKEEAQTFEHCIGQT